MSAEFLAPPITPGALVTYPTSHTQEDRQQIVQNPNILRITPSISPASPQDDETNTINEPFGADMSTSGLVTLCPSEIPVSLGACIRGGTEVNLSIDDPGVIAALEVAGYKVVIRRGFRDRIIASEIRGIRDGQLSRYKTDPKLKGALEQEGYYHIRTTALKVHRFTLGGQWDKVKRKFNFYPDVGVLCSNDSDLLANLADTMKSSLYAADEVNETTLLNSLSVAANQHFGEDITHKQEAIPVGLFRHVSDSPGQRYYYLPDANVFLIKQAGNIAQKVEMPTERQSYFMAAVTM